jgi:hypothetical protein
VVQVENRIREVTRVMESEIMSKNNRFALKRAHSKSYSTNLTYLHDILQFIRNIKLVCIKHDNNQVGSFRKPFHDTFIVIVATPLFGSTQYTRRIHNSHILEERRIQLDAFQTRQKVVPKRTESSKWPIRLTTESGARNNLVLVSPQDGSEAIRRRFGANANAGELAPEQVLDKACLADAVV